MTTRFNYGDLCLHEGHLVQFCGPVEDGQWPHTEGWIHPVDDYFQTDWGPPDRCFLDDLQPLPADFWKNGRMI